MCSQLSSGNDRYTWPCRPFIVDPNRDIKIVQTLFGFRSKIHSPCFSYLIFPSSDNPLYKLNTYFLLPFPPILANLRSYGVFKSLTILAITPLLTAEVWGLSLANLPKFRNTHPPLPLGTEFLYEGGIASHYTIPISVRIGEHFLTHLC